MKYIDERRRSTDRALAAVVDAIAKNLGQAGLDSNTTIYVAGSGGRGEMSDHSDVDLFVARLDASPSDDGHTVRDAITRAMKEVKRPAPSKDGEYLRAHSAESLCGLMGTAADDSQNTFTARMLLLLESQSLMGAEVYRTILSGVIDKYWRNDAEHASDYQPYVLVNDIVRYWRTLLLNYEAKNTEKESELAGSKREAEKRLRSYKLRFSRCMTCFSVLAALLDQTARGPVTKDSAVAIVGQKPTQRIESLRAESTRANVDDLLERYETFLEQTDRPKDDLLNAFAEVDFRRARAKEGAEFGKAMFELLRVLAKEERADELFRYMVV